MTEAGIHKAIFRDPRYKNSGCGDGMLPGDVWRVATMPAPRKPAPKVENNNNYDFEPKGHPVFLYVLGALAALLVFAF